MNLKVSVIVPAYNIEKYIYKCVESIKNQTLQEIEIIIVNDGSNDNTLNIIEKLKECDSRIKVLNKKNEGSIEARKSGLEIASGEYILFVDGDDWLELNALEVLYNNAINNNSDIVVYNSYISYDDKRIELDIFKKTLYDDCIKNLFLDKIYPGLVFKMIKNEYIKNNNIEFASNISFAEDLATTSSLFMHNPKISYINDYLYNYYQRNDSISKKIDYKVLEINEAMKFIKKKLEEKDLYNKYKEEYEYMVYMHMIDNHFLGTYYKYDEIGKSLYNKYKIKKIKEMKNTYINNKINSYSKGLKLRSLMYIKSYRLGKLYDNLRGLKIS